MILRFAQPFVIARPQGLVPAVALASAAGAAFASASPTGLEAADVVARAALGAGVVLAGSRAAPATCAVAGALAVLCTGGSSEAALAAGAAFGLTAAVLATGEREAAPALLALAGAGLAQAALRLAWPDPTGTSALAAAVFVVPVLVSGLRRGPATARQVVGRATAGFVAFSMVASVLAVLAVLAARGEVDEGVRAARDALAAVERGERDAAAAGFDTAAAAFRKADSSIDAWWARPALAVPITGQHAKALRKLASAGADLAGVGARTARAADPDDLKLNNGGIDLEALAALRRAVEAAMASLTRANRSLGEAQSPWLVEPVADRLDELGGRVRSASRSTRTAVLALRSAPGLLGADGPRRYLLAVQTPAEARASGGLMGNFGELLAENGRISLGRFGRVDELNVGGAGAARKLSGPADYVDRYAPYNPHVYWQSVTMSPDFPSVARVMTELYPQSGGTPVDGVVSVDPFAFAAFLRLTGPLQVEGRAEPLTADGAPRVLLHDQYVVFAKDERVDFLGTATATLFARLTSMTLPSPRVIADALSPAVAGRHLQLESVHRSEQRFFEHIGAAGQVPPVRGDFLGVVTQNFNGNKIDWFLRRSYSYDSEYDPRSGALSSRLEVRLSNEGPAEGLPRSVIGYGGPIDPRFRLTEFGENFLMLSVYSPLELDSMTVDGQPVAPSQENELGRRVYSTMVSIPSRSTKTVRLTLSGRVRAGGAYRLDLLRQPTVAPDEATVSVSFPDAWQVESSSDSRRAVVSRKVVIDRTRTIQATFEKRQEGWLDRLRRGR